MRICLWAGAGAGKSTLASGVFYKLKCLNLNVELISEYIKTWAYEGKVPKSFDQLFILANQLRSEDIVFQNGVKHIITDSPVLMQVFYSRHHKFPLWQQCLDIAKKFEESYPSLNIFLDRADIAYNPHGRYETESQAREIDEQMKEWISEHSNGYKVFNAKDLDSIGKFVFETVSKVP